MEQLISFFTHNPFILIIIVGLLYSMFFRKSPIEKPGNRPGGRPGNSPNRMPDFGGSPVFAPKSQQPGDPARYDTSRPDFGGLHDPAPQPVFRGDPVLEVPTPSMPYSTPQTPSYNLQQRTETAGTMESRSVPTRSRITPKTPTEQPVAPTAERQTALSANDLAQAVVWAEIIGPPRAKKPYRR